MAVNKHTYRVTLLVPTAEISTSACYLVRSLMLTLGDTDCVQLSELVVHMELADEQVDRLQMATAEVLSQLRSKCGVTVRRVLSVELVRYGE